MKNPLHITTAFLGIYAGLIAIQHGIFESLQDSRAPGSLMFNAIGPPCQPEAVWHACFPAMTLIPNLLITGIAAILIGLAMVVWAAAFVGRKRGGLALGAPVRPGGTGWRIVSALWPWPLVLMAFWLPGSWLLGHFFGAAMPAAGGFLFLVFDIGLPVLAAISSFGREKRPRGS